MGYFDSDWGEEYDKQRRSRQRWAVIQSAGYGYLFGQIIGSSAYVLQTRQLNKAAIGSGAFLGICLASGSALRVML
eukprot:snap_masked-scaffold_1-processed-gene-10.14-mRNA-1 protein AED:1.00 eAED:1.00 QI:0/-1/0/0/-1/1/1/0/75